MKALLEQNDVFESGSSYTDSESEPLSLNAWISQDPSVLGDKVFEKWGADLLFLFKVLSVRVRSKNARGQQGSYPIKLFYTSNMPIILQFALVFNLYFISQLLYKRYNGNFLVNLLGKWKESKYSGDQFVLVGGLAYYITTPSSSTTAI
ncbi:hypothetical protein PS1_027672 [Malus domestica]